VTQRSAASVFPGRLLLLSPFVRVAHHA